MGWFSLCSILCLQFFLLHSLSRCSAFPSCRHDQSSALLDFKNSFSIEKPNSSFSFSSDISSICDYPESSYPKTSTWKNGTDCCLWDGVTCNALGHVTGLNLSCSWLHGKIHSNSSLFQLTQLQRLDLALNDFQGSHISSQFAQLVSLTYLSLSLSNFSGEIPSQISHLHKLVTLDLSWNHGFSHPFEYDYLNLKPSTWKGLIKNLTNIRELLLSGIDMSSIPPNHLLKNLSSSSVSLWLVNTRLQGNLEDNIRFPPNLQKISLSDNINLIGYLPKGNWNNSLRFLDLSRTSFIGELPHSIGHMKSLNELYLFSCQFRGKIPSSFWNLTQLTILKLYNNSFSGEILSSLSNLQHLTVLDLSSNSFSGEFPLSLSRLKNLISLNLQSNNFSGQILDIFLDLQQLTVLDLSSNNFSGELPLSLSRLQNLTVLDLQSNNFTSKIPNIFCQLTKLIVLGLSYNGLQGHLLHEIGALLVLEDLYLSHNLLNGTIPSWCFTLPSLKNLDLSNNQFTGQIGEISSYSLGSLDLSNNELYGLIPRSIFYLENLSVLNLSHNSFTGTVQHLSWKNMNYFDLSSNLLQGKLDVTFPISKLFFSVSHNMLTGSISSSICNASSLEILNLSHNNFTGTIPQCIGSSNLSLSVLDLQMNSFSGTIPNTFEVGNKLRTLNLNGNLLEGSLPQSLVNCTELNVLDLGRNNIEDAFPYYLQTLEKLQVLVLRENKLQGSITSFKDNASHAFPKLRVFDLSSNNFSGPLPATYFKYFKAMINVHEGEIGSQYIRYNNFSTGNWYEDSIEVTLKGLDTRLEKILTIFTTIDLSNNMFEGEIPPIIGELGSLKGLSLSHNRLIGVIPKSMGNLRNLEWLDLSSNTFIGKIPIELTYLNFLSVLNLSQNQLEGCIPSGKQFNTFTSDSFKGNIGLRGFQVSSACTTEEKRKPLLYSKHGFEFEFGWKPIVLGYGCGATFGATMGWVVILIGKPRWLIAMVERPPNTRKRRARSCCR